MSFVHSIVLGMGASSTRGHLHLQLGASHQSAHRIHCHVEDLCRGHYILECVPELEDVLRQAALFAMCRDVRYVMPACITMYNLISW